MLYRFINSFRVGGLLVSLLLLTQPLIAQTKRALIIAIGNYPRSSGWETISSINDIQLIESALAYQKFTDVAVVQDAKADKAGVMLALQKLVDQSQPGDKVVIHFSSHGQQITDDSGDELDGYDEAIVCYGAPVAPRIKTEYDGSQHLRDDELNVLIEKLRAKLGATGDILVIADACHSGTISRGGIAKVRGKAEPYDLPGIVRKTPTARGPQKPRTFMAPAVHVPAGAKVGTATGLAPYVIISAARASELNYEYILPDGSNKGVGSLSYVVNKALKSVAPHDTYRTLFNRIVSEMKVVAPQQTPEIDGDYDRGLFGGKAVEQAFYYHIQELKEGGRQLVIPAGRLETVNVDSKVWVCPEGTPSPAQATSHVSGTVVQAGMFSATIQLETPLTASQRNQYVFITEHAYGDLTVAVSTDSLWTPSVRSATEGALRALPLVKFVHPNESELYVAQRDSAGTTYALIRKTTDGFIVGEPISLTGAGGFMQIKERIENYAQGKFLRTFTADYEGIKLKIDLIPVKPRGKASDTLRQADYMINGLMRFAYKNKTLSDSASVLVTNTGDVAVYYSIIDIQPDGIVNVLFPIVDQKRPDGSMSHDYPTNYQIKPGEKRLIPTKVGFLPPFGTETFKIMASTEEFDLRNIMNMRSRGASATRGLNKAIEQIFGSAQVVTRGGGVGPPPPGAPVGTFDYPFLIVPFQPQ